MAPLLLSTERGIATGYSCNGYVPGIGLRDMLGLIDIFSETTGGIQPRRTYLIGTSLGGQIAVLGLHELSARIDGALAPCPSTPELLDFYVAVAAAAEVVTDIRFTSTSNEAIDRDIQQVAAITGLPPRYTAKARQLANVQIALSGGVRPFASEGLSSALSPTSAST